jgi:hypothetical protein
LLDRLETGVNRPADKAISWEAWIDVRVEVRQRIAVDLIVDLDRAQEISDPLGREQEIVPERGALIDWQLVRLDHVALGDNAHVPLYQHTPS